MSIKQIIPSQLKKVISQSIFKYRQITSSNRCLPNFIIIGAQKSGTTSLYYYLSQHYQLISSNVKEVHYFDGGPDSDVDNFKKGEAWYRAHFPLLKNIDINHKVYESSPLYIFNPLAPKRIIETIPKIKLVLILRNPTERAISHYFHEKRKGYESLSILEAFQEEEERMKSVIDEEDYKNDIFLHTSYKSRGLYFEQIKRYLNYFPRSSILILNSDDLSSEPEETLRQVYEFVGVDADYKIQNIKQQNVSSDKTEVEPGVRKYLDDYFAPHNQKLYELIGKDFKW
jgi:hypothetical protein